MPQENNSGSSIFLGFLAGGIIGAGLALLFAPKTGRELRNDIKNRTDEYLDEAEKYIAEARDKAKGLINDGKKRSEKIINDAKEKSEAILKDAEKILNDAKAKASGSIDEGKSKLEAESNNLKSAFKAGVEAYKETKKSS
jgi:gas vesicle protein